MPREMAARSRLCVAMWLLVYAHRDAGFAVCFETESCSVVQDSLELAPIQHPKYRNYQSVLPSGRLYLEVHKHQPASLSFAERDFEICFVFKDFL